VKAIAFQILFAKTTSMLSLKYMFPSLTPQQNFDANMGRKSRRRRKRM